MGWGGEPVSNQENGVDEFGASLLEIHRASSKADSGGGCDTIKIAI